VGDAIDDQRWEERAMTLTVSEEEQEVLGRILAGRLRDLRVEIRHTDSRDFRTQLRHEEELIEKLMDRLSRQSAA
jgi:hypothetical protein